MDVAASGAEGVAIAEAAAVVGKPPSARKAIATRPEILRNREFISNDVDTLIKLSPLIWKKLASFSKKTRFV